VPPVARSHVSAKQVVDMKAPFTQPTLTTYGSALSFVSALMFPLLNPVVAQLVMLPCPV
jgi:hypothetical protein